MNAPSKTSNQNKQSHRRRNALTGEWVLVSPHRLNRPWQGARSDASANSKQRVAHDSSCYLCAGNQRVEGSTNPDYQGVYVFDNDFPALQMEGGEKPEKNHPLFTWSPANGVCRVICFSPDHSRTLSDLSVEEVTAVVDVWAAQSQELGERFPDGSVQIFENKGQLMGCSNPHPHGQVWAQQSIPTLLSRELGMCKEYIDQSGSVLLADYVETELAQEERIVCANEHFVAVVPYWATWPFETLICPRRHVARMPQLSGLERQSLADLIRRLSIRYDNLFGVSFPYSAGLHQAPASGAWDDSFTLHMHFFPPLLRSAEVRKFMVGYEMLAEAQRDLTPEAAADVLRQQPESFAETATQVAEK